MGYVDGAIDAPPSTIWPWLVQIGPGVLRLQAGYALFEVFVEALTRIRALAAA
jgi:hypothetical protein